MPGTLGPELEVVSDEELRVASGGIDLEKATAALSNLTAAVEVLKAQIEKDEPVTDEQLRQVEAAAAEAGEAAATEEGAEAAPMDPAAVMAAIGEKAMMWAKELAEGADPDVVAEYVKELMSMLEALAAPEGEEKPEAEAEAEAEPPPPPPRGDQEEKRAPADTLKFVAESALGLASKIEKDAVISTEDAETLAGLVARMNSLVAEAQVEKAQDVTVAPGMDNTRELGAVAKGMVGFLRDIASRAGTVAATSGATLSDVAKRETGWVCAALEAAVGSVPQHVVKSEASFQSTVQEVAERALFLSRKVAAIDDKRVQKEAEQLLGLMSSLVEKYADRKEKGFDLPDYNVVIDVDRKLNDIEDLVQKAKQEAEAQETEVEQEAKAEEGKPEEAAPAEEKDEEKGGEKAEETSEEKAEAAAEEQAVQASVDKDAQDLSKALMDRIGALTGQVTELQKFIAKARNTVPSPAAEGEPEAVVSSEPSHMLFPMDYNDPAYRIDLDVEGED